MSTPNTIISPVNVKDRQQIDIKPGDTVRVLQKVEEAGGKMRLQPFEGVVLARKHGSESGATFTVRRTNDPYGTEKIFPLYSPMIDKIEIVKRAKVRRAKLYHIRKKAAKEIKRQMRNLRFVDVATMSDTEEKAKAKKAEDEEAHEASAAEHKEGADVTTEEKQQEDNDTQPKEDSDTEVVEEKEKK